MKKIIIILIALALLVAVVMSYNSSVKNDQYTYVITETVAVTSFDPLDADQTINLPVARMLYATPLEIDLNGNLTSLVLDFFEYDDQANSMMWKVKSNLKYSDGSILTTADVAFAVARMIYARSTFPVIEDIQGVKEWLQSKNALQSLPSGIQIDGQVIKIQFDKKQDHPMFRFCLEIFSIIPKNCVDLETNKIICKEIPSSGHYKLISKSENEFQFEKTDLINDQSTKIPHKIIFKYMSSQDAIKSVQSFDSQTIISGTELRYSVDEIKELQSKVQISFAPASRIVGLLINPNIGAFKNVKCRQVFAKAFRSAFYQVAGDARESESSLFTDLLPGYLKSEDLYKTISAELTEVEIKDCKAQFEKNPIKWLKSTSNPKSIFVLVMEKVFSELGIANAQPVIQETQKNEDDLFLSGEISIKGFQTGFWAFDPAGDVQMLMTPNMHKTLKFVSDDQKMQNLIRNLKTTNLSKAAFIELNQHVYQESRFNIFTHVRRFYAAKNKSLIAEAPVSITSPAPWQVFKVD